MPPGSRAIRLRRSSRKLSCSGGRSCSPGRPLELFRRSGDPRRPFRWDVVHFPEISDKTAEIGKTT